MSAVFEEVEGVLTQERHVYVPYGQMCTAQTRVYPAEYMAFVP